MFSINRRKGMMILLIMALVVVVLIIVGCAGAKFMKNHFMSSTDIVNKQTELRAKILSGDEIDVGKEIKTLEGQILIDSSFFGYNAIHENNIAVRNHLLLAVLYKMIDDDDNVRGKYKKAKKWIDHNLINGNVWSEGPSYYLYIEEMIDLYLDKVNKDNYLLNVKDTCRAWIKKYITPDNLLPPIGDTWRAKWEDSQYVPEKSLCYDSEQTLYKTENMYLLVRHPSCIYKYIKNGHIHYDVGDIVVYYGGKCVIFPVGYNGFDNKSKFKLYDLRNKNSIYLEKQKEPFWRFGYYRLDDIKRDENHIRISYMINGKVVVRLVYAEKNRVKITDIGSDGINLNIDVHKCDIVVKEGKKMNLKKGFHVDESGVIVKNDRVFIATEGGTTSVEISFK